MTESHWNGGAGYTLEQVGQMTLDQIWSRLCDIKVLQKDVGDRVEKMAGLNAVSQLSDDEGNMRGRSVQGEEIKLKKSGDSKAKMLRDGTYEGYVVNAVTGQTEYKSPNARKQRIMNRKLRQQARSKEQ